MNRKYALVDLEPNIDTTPGTAHGTSDILFDWTPIEIPTGACSIKTIHAIDIHRRRCNKFRSKIRMGGSTSISINNRDRCLFWR